MDARIYQTSKSVTQAGKAKQGYWILSFEAKHPKLIEPLMGYTSSFEPQQQTSLQFESLEEAVAFAKAHNISYRVDTPNQVKRQKVSYADNFSPHRLQPWTH